MFAAWLVDSFFAEDDRAMASPIDPQLLTKVLADNMPLVTNMGEYESISRPMAAKGSGLVAWVLHKDTWQFKYSNSSNSWVLHQGTWHGSCTRTHGTGPAHGPLARVLHKGPWRGSCTRALGVDPSLHAKSYLSTYDIISQNMTSPDRICTDDISDMYLTQPDRI